MSASALWAPCAAKKLEASRRSVRSEVDFVLTFEEIMGMFEAKEVDFASLPDDPAEHSTMPAPTAAALPSPAVWPRLWSMPSTSWTPTAR